MKKMFVLFMVLVLTTVPVFAGTTIQEMDPDREISLTVLVEDDDAVSGVGVTIYRIADVLVYQGAVTYESLITDVIYGGMTARENEAAAAALSEEDLSGIDSCCGMTDQTGSVVFSDLEPGAYLIVQSDGDQTFTFHAFIAFAPQCDAEDGTWIYDVTARPKTVERTESGGGEKTASAEQTTTADKTTSVKTGDDIEVLPYVIVMLICLGAAAVLIYMDHGKKGKREKKGTKEKAYEKGI